MSSLQGVVRGPAQSASPLPTPWRLDISGPGGVPFHELPTCWEVRRSTSFLKRSSWNGELRLGEVHQAANIDCDAVL
eukprot:2576135-Alexandrium_andersonii.AAC.1